MAEADGNRTRLTRVPGHIGFEDRGGHQAPTRLRGESRFSTDDAMTRADPIRLTQFGSGGVCACKIPAGGLRTVVAVNLLGWPRDVLPFEIAQDVLRGGADIAAEAGCLLAGGHSIDDPEPKYGLAVTGLADPARLLRNDAGRPGDPLTLTKPLGTGVLNNRHKQTGEVFPEAVASMTQLNRDAAEAAL